VPEQEEDKPAQVTHLGTKQATGRRGAVRSTASAYVITTVNRSSVPAPRCRYYSSPSLLVAKVELPSCGVRYLLATVLISPAPTDRPTYRRYYQLICAL
jgi:hypothetical protein